MSPAKHAFPQVNPHNRAPKQSLSCGTQVWGVVDMASAMPVPFLLGCLWTLAASLKIAAVIQN